MIEDSVGRKAEIVAAPLPPGDVTDTHADLARIEADYGYAPTTPIEVGIPKFVAWYRTHLRQVDRGQSGGLRRGRRL